jgi:hypothetical protein
MPTNMEVSSAALMKFHAEGIEVSSDVILLSETIGDTLWL